MLTEKPTSDAFAAVAARRVIIMAIRMRFMFGSFPWCLILPIVLNQPLTLNGSGLLIGKTNGAAFGLQRLYDHLHIVLQAM